MLQGQFVRFKCPYITFGISTIYLNFICGLCSGSSDRDNVVVKEAIDNLKYSCADSIPDLLQYWSVTHPLRCKILRETRPHQGRKKQQPQKKPQESNTENDAEEHTLFVSEYLQEWKVLSYKRGHLLVSLCQLL